MWWTYLATEKCKELYYDKKRSIEEIAEYFNVHEDSVRNVLGIEDEILRKKIECILYKK